MHDYTGATIANTTMITVGHVSLVEESEQVLKVSKELLQLVRGNLVKPPQTEDSKPPRPEHSNPLFTIRGNLEDTSRNICAVRDILQAEVFDQLR